MKITSEVLDRIEDAPGDVNLSDVMALCALARKGFVLTDENERLRGALREKMNQHENSTPEYIARVNTQARAALDETDQPKEPCHHTRLTQRCYKCEPEDPAAAEHHKFCVSVIRGDPCNCSFGKPPAVPRPSAEDCRAMSRALNGDGHIPVRLRSLFADFLAALSKEQDNDK